MHAYSMTAQDPQKVEESSMPVVSLPQEQKEENCSIRCGRRWDLIVEEVHGISISIPFVADISIESLHHSVNGLHHYGVEGTTACQGSSWIHSIRRHSSNTSHISTDRIKKKMEESHAGLIKASWSKHPEKSSVFQKTTRVEAVTVL